MVNCNVILQNITCANNTTETHGGGIYSESAPVEIINSILWDNAPNELGGSFLVSYSDIKSGGWPGAGNINLDPLFVGSGDYPYALQNDSPCVNTGIPDTTGLNLPEFDLAGNPRLYGGRIEMGAYENQNLAVGVEEFDSDSNRDLVGAFGVECYPNPFYNHTTIHHTLPNAGFVNLEIHNITGKKIKTLHSGFTPAGEHGFVWDAEGLKDGLYLMRLETDGISESRKLLLLQ